MGISDLAIFNEYMYLSFTEVIAQEIQKFNAASRGCITLSPSAHQGDYSEKAFYKKISGLVKRRNVYGSGAVATKQLEHLVDTLVKVAAGTPPVNISKSQFTWIQRNPEEGGAVYGQQLAQDALADMLNTAILGTATALSNDSSINFDGTAGKLNPRALNSASRLFGDKSSAISIWLAHSSPVHDFYDGNMANVERLFTYGSVNVNADPFGRIFVVTDSPSLVTVDGGGAGIDHFDTIGLVTDAVYVGQNNDFDSNTETVNGDENIARTIQSEWSYQLGVKGYAWDKTAGGPSPTDAAIATAGNWDRYSTSDKDLAGVVAKTL